MEEAAPASRSDPLDTPPPAFSLEEARAVAERVFGIAGAATPLGSERDQNLRLAANDGSSFLLKISNPADQRGALEMQSLAMLHITAVDPGLPVMRPQRSLDGSYHGESVARDGRNHIVRLFSFLPGRAVTAPELQASGLRAVGAAVARMGIALRGFFHPAGGYEILWNLKRTPRLRNILEHVSDGPRREMAERVLERFEQRVGPNLPSLRAQMIHNDLTLDNILLDESHQVSGIVDFGDLTHTALICDLAIALVSLMWDTPDPLGACRTAIEGYTSLMSIEEAEAEVLGDLIGARLVALGLIARWRVDRYPENADYITGNEEPAWALLDYLDTLTWPMAEERIRAACLSETRARSSWRPPAGELMERRRRVLGPALSALTYNRPLYLVRAQGTRMYDEQGAAYLDAYNNVPVVGHCHPRVSAAIAQQSRMLNTNTRYLHESVVELAERLVATMPGDLDTVMFFNSGSEANDIAWRLATSYTGGTGAVVTAHAYHGVTTATIALSPEGWAEGERPAHIETVPPPDGYRNREHGAEPVAAIDMALDALSDRGMKPAAFFIDPLFTSDGIHTPPPIYLQEIIRALHQAGALLVADEVQCGFGRSGSHLWSFEGSGITPDFVTLGKPMGNGYPIAAVVTRREIAERFARRGDMFSTFGGNPVACRAALAVLDVIENENLTERAHEVGMRLREGLAQVQERHPSIGDVRGVGLLIGVELVEDPSTREPAPRLAAGVMDRMREGGILIGSTGPAANVLKIRPPLVLTHEDADLIVGALDTALSEPASG